jgi:hypothetical protein
MKTIKEASYKYARDNKLACNHEITFIAGVEFAQRWISAMMNWYNIDLIKGIAVRASGVKHEESGTSSRFNRIPHDRLQSLYNAFLHRKNDFEFIDAVEAYMRLMDVSKRVN